MRSEIEAAGELIFNPFAPEARTDPYPHYAALRELDPVHYSPFNVWVLTRHDDCVRVLRDHKSFSNDHRAAAVAAGLDLMPESLIERRSRSLLFMDPPDHTRIRSLVTKAFTPRAIDALKVRIIGIVDDLVAVAREKGSFDLIADFAYPLPVTVIAEMLGVPTEDVGIFKKWGRDLVVTLDPITTPEQDHAAEEASMQLAGYFAGLLADRQQSPKDDLLTALVHAEDSGTKLAIEELLAVCILLLVAGHETTMNLIGNGTLALLRNPDEFQKLRNDPSLAKTAVEELLRYDSPVQLDGRTTAVETEIDGHRMEPGQLVIAVLGAANRDLARFQDPDKLDIGRNDAHHIAFGAGIHFCLGAPLARLEGQIALAALARLEELELDGDPEWRSTVTLRGLSTLPVTAR